MTVSVAFNIEMPNEPYVDDFSNGDVHASTYIGHKFISVSVDADGWVISVLSEADTEAGLVEQAKPTPENHTALTIDATANPFEASYVSRKYTTGAVANYTENLGTTDDNGDPETWEYTWHENGVLSQIYLHGTLKYSGGAFQKPTMRIHAFDQASFNASMGPMSAGLQEALDADSANQVYSAEQRQAIIDHKTYVDNITTKYAAVKHWKVPFKPMPHV